MLLLLLQLLLALQFVADDVPAVAAGELTVKLLLVEHKQKAYNNYNANKYNILCLVNLIF